MKQFSLVIFSDMTLLSRIWSILFLIVILVSVQIFESSRLRSCVINAASLRNKLCWVVLGLIINKADSENYWWHLIHWNFPLSGRFMVISFSESVSVMKLLNYEHNPLKFPCFKIVYLGRPRGIVVKVLDCGGFELQSWFYVHFRVTTFGKGMNSSPTMG